mgnify:FL=1|tara:strand:+ start:416 stop:1252 length:837 start_codon:yes stop_codon:yes gene_type:complete
MKSKKNILGVTLVEILIGIVISTIMMGAMFASYTAVNSSFQKVVDKAQISQTGRDVLGMLLRDIRMAGFKYYGDNIKTNNEHTPILITKTSDKTKNCDTISIVYGDVDYDKDSTPKYTYKRYKISYFCEPTKIIDKTTGNAADAFALFKTKQNWNESAARWEYTDPPVTYEKQLVVNYVQDLIFNAIDADGVIINPPPSPTNQNNDKIFGIKTVDIGITVRSKNDFYKEKNSDFKTKTGKDRKNYALSDTNRDLTRFDDKFLRETITVTAHARNLGLQ